MAVALTEDQRAFIVRRLAKFYLADEIIKEFSTYWSEPARLDLAEVRANDPTKGLVDDKFIAIFNAVRVDFIKSGRAFPLSEVENQLGELQSRYDHARDNNRLDIADALFTKIMALSEKRKAATAGANSGIPEIKGIVYTIIDPLKPDQTL